MFVRMVVTVDSSFTAPSFQCSLPACLASWLATNGSVQVSLLKLAAPGKQLAAVLGSGTGDDHELAAGTLRDLSPAADERLWTCGLHCGMTVD